MENDLYDKYCASNNLSVDENIKKAFVKAGISGELSLAGITLTASACDAVGSVLCMCRNITRLDLSDCLLPVLGLNTLLPKVSNSQLSMLNLKGNNIFGQGTAILSRLLLKNKAIKVLKLEWNNLGASVECFSQLCHALANNPTLEILDLRNNELTPDCGADLADAIARNTTLRELDLRWNNLGADGGQCLLTGLRSNKSLTELWVQGNMIPSEVVLAIEESVDHNKTVQKMQNECSMRNELLTKHIQFIQQQRTEDLKLFSHQNALQIQPALNQLKEQNKQLRELEGELGESRSQILRLEAQIATLGTELAIAEQNTRSAESAAAERDQQIKSLREQAKNDHDTLIKKLNEQERELSSRIEGLLGDVELERKSKERLEVQVKESQNYIDVLSAEISGLKTKLLKITAAHSKDLEEERRMHEENLNRIQQEVTLQQIKASEMLDKAQQVASQKVLALENKLEALETAKAELGSQYLTEKAKWTEEKSAIWAEASEKQVCKLMLLNDKLEHAKEDKNRLEQELKANQMTIANLQRENSSLKSDLAEPPRKIAQLQEELGSERILTQRLRSEKTEEVRAVEMLKQEVERYRNELASAQRQIADLQGRHDLAANQHSRELESVNWKLEEKAKEIAAIRAEELERAGVLYSALNRYLTGLQHSTPKV